jgi:nucleoside-diphosphate-sugar epimerase
VVFHCAGRTFAATRQAFDASNAHLTREVALAAQQAGARLVHVSSQAAAGPAPIERPRGESDDEAPCSPYGASKLAGERIVAGMSALEWTTVRPVAVYGPRDRAFLPLFRLARAGYLPVLGNPAVSYMLVHVHDVVDALERAALRPEAIRQVCFVGHPEPLRLDRILDAIARAVGRRVRVVSIGSPWLSALAWGGSLASWCGLPASFDRSKLRELQAGGFVCSVARAAHLLGSVPAIPLEDGMASTADWYRAQGLLRPFRR